MKSGSSPDANILSKSVAKHRSYKYVKVYLAVGAVG